MSRNSTSHSSVALREGTGDKLRNALIAASFALVLLVPKIINLRRNARSWFVFRLSLAVAGAALVILPLSLWNSYLLPVGGLAMFVAAVLLPPATPDSSTDDKARALGALIVVNGGQYQRADSSATPVQLFVGDEHIWALDPALQPLLKIPVGEIFSARAENIESTWVLHVSWSSYLADFVYHGIFAEHLARVAETTLHNVMRPTLPVIPQRRAASA